MKVFRYESQNSDSLSINLYAANVVSIGVKTTVPARAAKPELNDTAVI